MDHPPFYRCRVLCDFDRLGNLIQIGWEVYEGGELTVLGMCPVGPFDSAKDIERHVAEMVGVPLVFDLS